MGDVASLHQRQKPGLATLVRVSGGRRGIVLSAIESDPSRAEAVKDDVISGLCDAFYYSDAELLRAVWRDAC
jgi:hypothetical protein